MTDKELIRQRHLLEAAFELDCSEVASVMELHHESIIRMEWSKERRERWISHRRQRIPVY